MHLFCLLVLALIAQHQRQVVHARQCGWMLFAQNRLIQPECLSMHLFRLLVLALTPQHHRQVVHVRQCGCLCWTGGEASEVAAWTAAGAETEKADVDQVPATQLDPPGGVPSKGRNVAWAAHSAPALSVGLVGCSPP